MADALVALRQENDRRAAALAAQGIQVAGRELLLRDVFLEHILTAVAGHEGLRACRLEVEKRVSLGLDDVESQMDRIRQARAAQILGVNTRP